jgi:hypothetical protein
MFTKLKAALARLFGIGEAEAHALITALEEDAAPLFDQFRAELLADVKVLLAEGVIDYQKLAAEIAKILGEQPAPAPTPEPAPVQPPAAG